MQSWEAISDPPSHRTRTTPCQVSAYAPRRNPLFLHPSKIAGLKSKRKMPTNTLNCEPLSKFAERYAPFSYTTRVLAALSFWSSGVSIPGLPGVRLSCASSAYLLLQAVLYHFPRASAQTTTPQRPRVRARTSPNPRRRPQCQRVQDRTRLRSRFSSVVLLFHPRRRPVLSFVLSGLGAIKHGDGLQGVYLDARAARGERCAPSFPMWRGADM